VGRPFLGSSPLIQLPRWWLSIRCAEPARQGSLRRSGSRSATAAKRVRIARLTGPASESSSSRFRSAQCAGLLEHSELGAGRSVNPARTAGLSEFASNSTMTASRSAQHSRIGSDAGLTLVRSGPDPRSAAGCPTARIAGGFWLPGEDSNTCYAALRRPLAALAEEVRADPGTGLARG
jgi:hypothetical protein